MSDKPASPYHLQGQVNDYDVDGDGTCLTTALIAYAADCRRAAQRYQEDAAALLIEAARAETAATAAEMFDPATLASERRTA